MKGKNISPLMPLSAWVIFIFIFCPELHPQAIKCFFCNREINGTYIVVDGNYYHPEHFLCKKCGKQIKGSYQKLLDDYYHLDCYEKETAAKCDVCNQIITGEMITQDLKFYHPECYRKFIVPKCSVCLEPLEGEYKIDVYGNKFHSWHIGVLDQCETCGRIISKSLTNGGRYYDDGRHICNLCYEKAVFSQSEIRDLLAKVIDKLIEMGISLDKNNISVHAVDKNELKSISGMEKFDRLEGFCKSQYLSDFVKNKKKNIKFTHKIYVLTGLPSLNIEAILAHELTHAWAAENTPDNQPPDVREGSCNFISYQYLFYSTDPEVKFLLLNMEKNPDPVYGLGFQKIRNKFYGKPVSALLDYLKTGN
ncbi:MAG: protein DA1 [Ignavibacteriaceae bacterium]|nr:protein DA1 [Ignavibacteriaceae bacterium]